MLTCCCSLAGTEACKKCPQYIAHFGKQEIREIYTIPTQTGTLYASETIEPKSGYWERIPYSVAGGFRCSLCHCKTLSKHWNYCPNCGADMRGDKK